MRILTRGHVDAASVQPRGGRADAAATVAAPTIALAGTAAGVLAERACAAGLALPSTGLALTSAGAVLWLAGRSRELPDRFAVAIGMALVLLSLAALQQLLACALGRTGLPPVELLRTGGLVLLFAALLVELDRRRRTRAAAAAVALERRRLARELHDGIAQELAYARTQSRRIAGAGMLVEAIDRALEESRAAIAGLVRSSDEPLEQSIEAAAVSIGERHGVEVHCDLAAGVVADDMTRDALLRILREAIANAARHGGASSVRVELRAGPHLSIADDGNGFDPSKTVRPDSHGLASMRERTEALGGHFALRSLPELGTCVEVALP
jgi:signal transduction histidine kinase